MNEYVIPTRFIDSDHEQVIDFAHSRTSASRDIREKVVDLYYAVRDEILYSPYHLVFDPNQIAASLTLQRKYGYCIEKSLLLAAAARVHAIPSRLGFSIVRNHISTEKFRELLRSDKFVFHGYNEFFIDGKWVKCTPAFNKSLCDKFNVPPLEFDGIHDSIFQQYTADGKQYMEYLHEYGQFADFPYDLFIAELKIHYPHFFETGMPIMQNK
jgi:transglutaminase-like putative cysteine protease